ncbi:hypothetical protein C2W62_04435 [Candidatus Entotheonella serta]|nr:hypothetical protein C2W62_04435 [Candidatus Entotheonella serta]
MLIADTRGVFIDAELLIDQAALIHGGNDLLVHANHLEAELFDGFEEPQTNSLCRRHRLQQLFDDASSPLTVTDPQGFYRDHENAPHSLCAHPFEGRNLQTVVSVIGNLTARELYVAKGSPCQAPYATYTLATCQQGALSVQVEDTVEDTYVPAATT